MKNLFPIVLLALQVAASVVYFAKGDWRRGFYWLFAVGITYVVTF